MELAKRSPFRRLIAPIRCCRLAGLWLVLLLALQVTPLAAQTPAARLTLDEYHALLREAITALETEPPGEYAALDEQRRRLASVQEVVLPSGEIVRVRPLLGSDEAPVFDRQAALARLRLMVTQLDAAPEDATAARLALLEQILARPLFNRPSALIDRFIAWVEEWLRRLLGREQDAAPSPALAATARAIPWVLAALAALGLGWLLTYWLQSLLRSFVADAEARRRAAEGENAPLTAGEARRQAHHAAQAGRYRDAVRRLYLAALLHLQEARLVPPDPSLTNHELLARVPAGAPLHSYLAPVVETFDQVWYGVREPDHATYSAYLQAVDALESSVRAHADAHTRTQTVNDAEAAKPPVA
ncbi:MAG TPA: DUF4129 domain-containing protein [Caldilineaceae bacterium]|nr:DUF4129 domain-containing protein [Caldilineaceae bacterium]